MKYQLFINNFRGFNDTFVPIIDVNFLVGENSTGKTSVLGLLRMLLDTHTLLMSQDFADEGLDFGNFPDMVSIHSNDQKRFDIGLIRENSPLRKNESANTGFILTYIEDKGIPKLAKCTFCLDTEEVSLRFIRREIYFKWKKFPAPPSIQQIRSVFQAESKGTVGKEANFQKVVTPSGIPSNVPPLFALSLVRNQVEQEDMKIKGRGKREISFYPDFISFSQSLCWVAPIRTKPKRTYDVLTREFSPEGEHTPYLLRGILRSKSQAKRFRDAICKAGKATGLFQDVRIKNFGTGATAPFEVDIVLDDKALNINTVGYGVSQSLPVLVELLARHRGSWFAIQQPEVHLHPRAQAAFGDVLFEMAVSEEKRFVIETHSDFMIDRFRMGYRSKKGAKPQSQILFFQRDNGRNSVTPLAIGESGEMPEDQPDNYRSFFVREQMDILGL